MKYVVTVTKYYYQVVNADSTDKARRMFETGRWKMTRTDQYDEEIDVYEDDSE